MTLCSGRPSGSGAAAPAGLPNCPPPPPAAAPAPRALPPPPPCCCGAAGAGRLKTQGSHSLSHRTTSLRPQKRWRAAASKKRPKGRWWGQERGLELHPLPSCPLPAPEHAGWASRPDLEEARQPGSQLTSLWLSPATAYSLLDPHSPPPPTHPFPHHTTTHLIHTPVDLLITEQV